MKYRKTIWLELAKALNAIVMTLPFADVWYGYYQDIIASPFYNKGNWLVIAIFLAFYITFGRVYDAFSVSRNHVSEMVYSQSLSAIISDFFMYLVIWLLAKHLRNPLPLLLAFVGQCIFAVAWAVLVQKWYFLLFGAKKTAIVYDMRPDLDRDIQDSWLKKKYDIVLKVDAKSCIQDLSMLNGIEAVFLSGVHSHDRNIILKHCIDRDIEAFVIPRIGDMLMSSAKRMHMFHLPMLRVGRYAPATMYLVVKRVFDIFASLLAIVLLSPILLITAIAIKATDKGPVFYRQRRLTKDGKEFEVIKFRSMRVDAEKDGVARLSSGDADDRITPVGRIIRKVRIDELPQIFNILKGDMTIVGPRPERPEIAAQYEQELPEFRFRLQAKAGLTGYAQVYGKYNTSPYDKLQMDLMYIAHPSVLEDLRIMFVTVKILFMPESTEGVAAGQVTAVGEAKDTNAKAG